MSSGSSDSKLYALATSALNYFKKLPETIKRAFQIEDSSKNTCRYCRERVRPPNEFCGQECVLKYWEAFRKENHKISDEWLCSMPGCDKPCWVENDRVHDCCSKNHARELAQIKDHIQQMKHSSSLRSRFGSAWSDSDTIYFYNKDDPFYEFTNFHWAPIQLDQKVWYTIEHYFQAQKFIGTPHLDMIPTLSSAREAFEYSRKPTVSRWCRKDWEHVKIKVMLKALLAKFTQHGDLRHLLLRTGNRKLIEHSQHDSFWGDGGDGKGENHLGKLLMDIRDELHKHTQKNLAAGSDSGDCSTSSSSSMEH